MINQINNNLPKGWRKVKLGEIANVRRGASPRPIHKYISKSGMPWLKIGDITSVASRFVYSTKEFIKEEGIKKSVIVHPGDLILSNSATPGIPKFMRITACVHDGWLILEPKNQQINKEFLYYKLIIDREKLVSGVTGAIFDNLKTEVLREHEILLPPEDEQKRIADILSAFDDKIELNNKIIKTLEEMAQEVFKEWFVRFRFPGWQKVKFIDSELGRIPEGWEVKNIMEIIKRLPVGKKYDNKTALPMGKVPILDQGQSGIIGFHNEEPSVKANPQNPVAVFSNHTCYYRLVTFDFSCIQNVIPYVGTNGYSTTFVFYLTKDKIKMNDYKGHWPEFANQKFVIPSQKLSIEYSEKIQPIVEKVDGIRKENQTLAELRDLLLPKLMSGEIRV